MPDGAGATFAAGLALFAERAGFTAFFAFWGVVRGAFLEAAFFTATFALTAFFGAAFFGFALGAVFFAAGFTRFLTSFFFAMIRPSPLKSV
ncbi:MAG: hypothetical protein M5U15_04370 [Kiritimatiellae bacterium]|nr:hypothetical protein [Kiritimatiellia bacterium]